MNVYINSFSAISPLSLDSDENLFLELTDKECLRCTEPDYKNIIDKKYLRRMSRILKMSTAKALKCLADSSIEQPDAIITGTGLGCIADTTEFLNQISDNAETLLNPTAFIQSTHNTPSGLIALMLGCKNANYTFSQEDTSFESALLHSIMMLESEDCKHILTGSMDEVTDEILPLLLQTKCFSEHKGSSYVPGEGSAFFMLSNITSEKNIARIEEILYFEDDNLPDGLVEKLKISGCYPEKVSMILTGSKNNNAGWIEKFGPLHNNSDRIIYYKNYCGEYYTSISFALYLALSILRGKVNNGISPMDINCIKVDEKILIHNENNGRHSLILISKC